MLTIFNRKELIFNRSMKVQGDVRMLLAQNKIPYKVKTMNRSGAGRSRSFTGTAGMNPDVMYEYRIFVHQDDYERAKKVIGR